MSDGEPKLTVYRILRRKQIHFRLAIHSPYGLHHLKVKYPFPEPQPCLNTMSGPKFWYPGMRLSQSGFP